MKFFVFILALASSLIFQSSPVRAETGAFDIQLAAPTFGLGSGLGVDSARTREHLELGAGVSLNWAGSPLYISVATAGGGEEDVGAMVGSRLDLSIKGVVGLFGIAELGVGVPLVMMGGSDARALDAAALDVGLGAFETVVAGDLRLAPRIRVMSSEDSGVYLAVGALASVPLGDDKPYAREGAPLFEPTIWLTTEHDVLGVRASVVARLREPTELETIEIDDELAFGLGLDLEILPTTREGTGLSVMADLYGRTPLATPFGIGEEGDAGVALAALSPVEALVGVRAIWDGAWSLSAAAGGGIHPGYGTGAPRVVMEMRYESSLRLAEDTDGDGILDAEDSCIDEPEDFDGFEDSDGCREDDNDKDMVLDEDDACPNDAEDRDGVRDEDGCPELDNDEDGVADTEDQCPREREDLDGFQDDDGCADLDNDGDGFADVADRCPLEAEDVDGFEDTDGCPDPDNDGDGVADGQDLCPRGMEDRDGVSDEDGCPEDNDVDGIWDTDDRCPNEPETYNGVADLDGCPDLSDGASAIRVDGESIELLEPVAFKWRGVKLKPEGRKVLEHVAAYLRAHIQVRQVVVIVRVFSLRSTKKNYLISKRRADAIRKFLSRGGVEAGRILLMPMGAKPGRNGKKIDGVEISIEEVLPWGKSAEVPDGPVEQNNGEPEFEMEF